MALVEFWRSIPNFPGFEVSNFGKVRRVYEGLKKPKILKSFLGDKGYLNIALSHKGIVSVVPIHCLVAEVFLEKSKDKDFIVHIDKNRHNNRVDNLKYVHLVESILVRR